MDRKLSTGGFKSFGFCQKLISALLCLLWVWVLPCPAAEGIQRTDHLLFERVKNNIQPLDFDREQDVTAPELTYFQYYGLDFKKTRHLFGSFKSGRKKLASHIIIPNAPKGTIILLHGYFDHTGTLKNLIQFCIEQSWSVALYDLPGHGLSSGKRLSVNHFSEYATVLNDFIKLIQSQMHGPSYLIGHSTGCAIIYEYLNHQSSKKQFFERIVFLAPLVRHPYWYLSTMNYKLAKPFTDSFPRKFRENSSDPDFLIKTKKDPLQEKRLPIKWLEALYSWNNKIKGYDRLPLEILIVQGEEDKVVDWKYNVPFLKKKFETVIVKWIPEARHQLMNEKVTLRGEVFQMIADHIE